MARTLRPTSPPLRIAPLRIAPPRIAPPGIAPPGIAPPGIAHARTHAPLHASPAPLRVLVVDDNADAAAMLAEVVRLGGHVPQVAGSAHDALDCVARDGAFDVGIVDIGLPDLTG